jgi:hypothetical protein
MEGAVIGCRVGSKMVEIGFECSYLSAMLVGLIH